MATRSLTVVFKDLRTNKPQVLTLDDLKAASAVKPKDFDFSLGGKENGNNSLVAIDLEASTPNGSPNLNVPKMKLEKAPAWLLVIPTIEAEIELVQTKMDRLAKLHSELPSFNFAASSSKQSEIDEKSAEVNAALQKCGKAIKNIGANQNLSPYSEVLAANVRNALALRLQEISSRFRRSQESYLTTITERVSKIKPIVAAEESSDEDDASFLYKTNDIELQSLKQEKLIAKERDQEVNKLVDSIKELSSLFGDLSTMVADQGTVLDRIDYNIVATSEHSNKAVEELKDASSSQSSSQKWLIGLLVAVVIVTIIIIIVFMARR